MAKLRENGNDTVGSVNSKCASNPRRSSEKSSRRRGLRRVKGGGIGMTLKVFGFLVAFTVIVLAVVWVLQIGLLGQFYEQTKYDELERAESAIFSSLENGGEDLGDVVDRYSTDYLMCVRVFRIDGEVARQIASADVSGDCIIHRIPSSYLNHLYKMAAERDGLFVKQYVSEKNTSDKLPTLPDFNKDNGEATAEDSMPPLISDTDDGDGINHSWGGTESRSINAVYVRLVRDSAGGEYIIMLNSEMAPLSTTVQMLRTQFGMIAVILLICSLVLSFVISKNISKPIIQMNESAKGLAKGNYNADFGSHGYREVIELSDTLESVADELSQNDRLQKELIANISHDLRTPLTMITGYGEVMRDIPGENTPENIQVVIDETRRLSELVNDLLDLSKLQAGTLKPQLQVIDLSELICSTMGRYEKLTRHEGYRIEYRFTSSVCVLADKTMLLQVVYNLINNAINYTGEDKYVCVRQQISEDGKRVRVSVTDSGEGIEADKIAQIWDRYYKVDKVHKRATVGTGLGLSIVKNVLEQHGANYGVDSRVGEGSTFWFELDVYVDTEPSDGPIDADYMENK
ncbi:MAG: HAMP domain-containing histidine kinase [Ruminococcaceae bacterium]|nr:HAMP domain-containing histidine kinase [Oscillospiraceae bacterium]